MSKSMTNRELATKILNTKKDLMVPVHGIHQTLCHQGIFYVPTVKKDFCNLLMSHPDHETQWELDCSFKDEMYLDLI